MANGDAVENARSAEQARAMQNAAKKKKCIFCDIDLNVNKPLNKKGEFDPEGKDWERIWVWENPFPQENQSRHIMFIPKRHINNENWDELTELEWLEILDAWKWACEFYNIPGGGFVGRFGERSYNAGTIGHLHFQLQIPDGTGNVKATFFKDMSPAEQARRANRKTYSQKMPFTFSGYIIFNEFGNFLNKDFHWEKFLGDFSSAFVHTREALLYIANLFPKNEVGPHMAAEADYDSSLGITNHYAMEEFHCIIK